MKILLNDVILKDSKQVKSKSFPKSNNTFLTELIKAVEEVKLIKTGKLTGRPAESLLNEL